MMIFLWRRFLLIARDLLQWRLDNLLYWSMFPFFPFFYYIRLSIFIIILLVLLFLYSFFYLLLIVFNLPNLALLIVILLLLFVYLLLLLSLFSHTLVRFFYLGNFFFSFTLLLKHKSFFPLLNLEDIWGI